MDKDILISTARDMVAEGKASWPPMKFGTIKRRLDSINVPQQRRTAAPIAHSC
jgi:hypothetical protein